jgi:hypothetical protein
LVHAGRWQRTPAVDVSRTERIAELVAALNRGHNAASSAIVF